MLFALAVLSATGFVGPDQCASCHKQQYESQVRSRHAAALRRIAASPWKPAPVDDREFSIRYHPTAEAVEVRATTASGSAASATLEWAFGAGAQGITPVGHYDGRWFEHRFSWYARPGRLAPTFGHPARPATAAAELGVPLPSGTLFDCFNCHATGVQRGTSGPDIAAMIPGVACERCHGPGAAHIAATESGGGSAAVRRAIVNPRRFTAKAEIEMCGQCHRLPAVDMGAEPEIEDPVNVRFAPVGLSASRCFQKSRTLRCTTCHDPHSDARPRSDVAAYAPKCLGCHDTAIPARSRCARPTSRECVSCHMPTALLGPYLRFTDHRIRVK